MGASCKEIAETLIDCIKKTDCVKEGSSIKDCLGQMKDNGAECQEFRNAYFTCKRSGLDMRTRIKGQKVY
jgi:Cytochrome c oxidase assembly protein PET191